MGSAAQLHFGTDLHHLAALLHAGVRAFRTPERGALAKVYVVAPHRAMREWLKQELAALSGAAGNVRFLSPGQVLARCGRSTGGVVNAVLRQLEDPTPFPAAKQYIEHDGDDPARRELRAYTLASRLASQFEAYAAQAFTPSGKDWRTKLWSSAVSSLALTAPLDPLDGPLFVFDVPVPGVDFIEATALLAAERHVFLRAAAKADAGSLWQRHGRLRLLAEERWRACGARVATPAAPPALQIPELTMYEAPSMRRACEVVATQLWSWVREASVTPPLRFSEMAIAVPRSQQEKLQPILREVLEEAHEIPKVVWNVLLGPNNRVATLAQQLLELPSTELRRAEVLSVLTHPLVHATFADDLPEAWADWLDAVGIFHGLDDRAHDGTYLEGRHFAHWDQGLTRLALGAFLGAERSGEVSSLELPGWAIEPEEVSQSSLPSLGLLLQFVRSLLSDAVALRNARLEAGEWKEFLSSYLATYLKPAEDSDVRVRNALLARFSVFDELGLEGVFGWQVAKTAALGALGGASGSIGQHLGQGVVIGTPEDLAGLPFRRLVVLGLEEGSFPSRSRLSELDQRVGDDGRQLEAYSPDDPRLVDARNFFDLVQSASGPVCLVPIAHDPLTGERREPASLVKDLEFDLRREGRTLVKLDVPLHRRVDAEPGNPRAPETTWAFPESAMEQQLFEVGTKLTKRGEPLPALSAFTPEWQATFGWRPMPAPAPGEEQVIDVWLNRLVKFLEYPTQAYAEQRLNLRRVEDGHDELSDEPFEHSGLSSSALFSDTLAALLAEHSREELETSVGPLLRRAYEQARARLVAKGRLAVGRFGALQEEQDLEALAALLETSLRQPEFQPPYQRLRLGPSTYARDAAVALPAIERKHLVVRGVPVTVRLTGLTQFVSADRSCWFRFKNTLFADLKHPVAFQRRHGLQAWVEHLLLEVSDEPRKRGALAIDKNSKLHGWTLRRLGPEAAGKHLDLLLEALLNERIGFKLPTLALLHHWDALAAAPDWEAQRQLLEGACEEILGERGADTERFGVVTRVADLRLPEEGEYLRMRARLAPWMEGRAEDEAERKEALAAAKAAAKTSTSSVTASKPAARRAPRAPAADVGPRGPKKRKTGGKPS